MSETAQRKKKKKMIFQQKKEIPMAGFEPATFRVIACKATALATAPHSLCRVTGIVELLC